VGWGLAGFCPGPAVTALGFGSPAAVIFVAAMMAGMLLARWLANRPLYRASPPLWIKLDLRACASSHSNAGTSNHHAADGCR
jgi:uncharacterized membrane protein YedE/YeeE